MFELALEDANFQDALRGVGILILPIRLEGARPGDIVILDGKKHRIIKIHEKAIAFRRVYWYSTLLDKLLGNPPAEW